MILASVSLFPLTPSSSPIRHLKFRSLILHIALNPACSSCLPNNLTKFKDSRPVGNNQIIFVETKVNVVSENSKNSRQRKLAKFKDSRAVSNNEIIFIEIKVVMNEDWKKKFENSRAVSNDEIVFFWK